MSTGESAGGGATRPVFVGRQPILDTRGRTFGYELLFRAMGIDTGATIVEGSAASAQVITRAFTDIGLDDLVGDVLAFINLSRLFFEHTELVTCLPSDRVVLEILEDVEPTAAVTEGVQYLCDLGYTIALDDFVPDGPTAPLRGFASIVKYEYGALDAATLQHEIERDHRAGRRVVVERIETEEQHAETRAAGADYFQGFHFARVSNVSSADLPTNLVALVRLAAELNRPDSSTAEIVDLLTQDVALSVKILRVVNSAAGGLSGRVESIHHAALLIGRERLRGWAALVLLAAIDDRPAELVRLALTRAKFCELLASSVGFENPSKHFTVGMLSLLEPMTGVALDVLIERIGVDDTIRAALLLGEGAPAETLDLAIELEACDDSRSSTETSIAPLELHRKAIAWATKVSSAAA